MTTKTIEIEDRTVGYSIANNDLDTDIAICYFYPLGGCSEMILQLAPAVKNVKAKLVCVDRPGCAKSSWDKRDTNDKSDAVMHRIWTHANDVLQVLKKEGIHQVYILGVCIGHAYAMEVSKRLLLFDENDSAGISLKAITLVAPFVSTACPTSWRVARFGYYMPVSILNGASRVKNSMFPLSLKYMGPSMLKMLVGDEDNLWTNEDYRVASKSALEMNEQSAPCQAMEVRVGVNDGWQASVCDEFARVYQNIQPDKQPPMTIHVCKEDKLTSMEAIDWITNRCYPTATVVTQDKIHSHEVMTMFGGPARNPVLLYQICTEWGLYNSNEEDEAKDE